MRDLILHPAVDDEIESRAAYLADHSERAPFAFIDEIQAAFLRIRLHPTRHHFTYREYRRANMHRFSCSIIYRERSDAIYVIAVVHERRHPDFWKHRISDDTATSDL